MKPVLTLLECAELLRVHPDTVRKLCHDKAIPHRRVGRQYRFIRSDIESWLHSREAGHAASA